MEQKRKLKIAIDLDGVIWDLVPPWVARYNELYNDNILVEEITDYDMSKVLKKATPDQIFNILEEEGFWNKVYPFEHSFEYLKKLNDEYEVYVATKTYYSTFCHKVSRLIELFPFLNPNQVICINNKQLLKVDYLVDDYVNNLIGGTYGKIIIDAPYNRDIDLCCLRARDLKDVYNYMKER